MLKKLDLLFPGQYLGIDRKNEDIDETKKIPDDFIRDLNLESIAREILPNNPGYALTILTEIQDDPDIINYRLDILNDFINIPELGEDIIYNINFLFDNRKFSHAKNVEHGSFLNLLSKIYAIENFIEYIRKFYTFINDYKDRVKSEGIKNFFNYITEVHDSQEFSAMASNIAHMKKILQTNLSSVTLGINFDAYMKPVEAVILAISSKPFKKLPLIAEMFNIKSDEESPYGISTFHKLDPNLKYSGLDGTLFQDLECISRQVVEGFTQCLELYYDMNVERILDLQEQCDFYFGAAKFVKYLKSHGLKMCRPEVAPKEDRIYYVKDIVDLPLVLMLKKENVNTDFGKAVVANDVNMSDNGRIFILTGPNSGGKTTYTRAIGVAQVLCQAGIFIPGTSARISPVDRVYTHFPKEEVVAIDTSRLTEEYRHFVNISTYATRYSLILFNEPFSSTTATESQYFAEGVLKCIRRMGCRAVFTTHLLELAHRIDKIHSETQGDSNIISMVAGMETGGGIFGNKSRKTYKITPGLPYASSFASQVIEKCGISFDQIMENIDSREKAK
jgi:DNA mismatch repair protein MutS